MLIAWKYYPASSTLFALTIGDPRGCTLRAGRVPNSSSIFRCMHLKSSELVVIKTA